MSRRERGIAVYASQFGISNAEAERIFTERYGERMAEEAFNAQGGSTWEADALSLRDRSLIVLATLITQGSVESRLRQHVGWALEHGATTEELEALASLLAVYTGYPRASVGMEIIRDVLTNVNHDEEDL